MLTARKVAELRHRLASLSDELTQWRAETADGGRLEKHWSQVEAVTTELSIPLQALHARVERLDGAGALEEASAIEGIVAELHRLWDMFRSRLSLRYVERFAPYLLGADELAYRCYEPAEAHGAGREPPLVAFADRVSPVTRARGEQLRPADALGPGDPLGEALRRLPMALIDLPWSQVEHLPDAPIIAHEVGHDVEADLALASDMEAALDAALARAEVPPERRRAWSAWRSEAFADVFGTLCLGPAFASALLDLLASAPRNVAGESQAEPHWRPHPPSTVRIELSAQVLARAGGFAAEAQTVRSLWSSAYPARGMTEFLPDIEAVADALVGGPYTALGACTHGGPLTSLVSFSAGDQRDAARDARELLQNRPAEGDDARVLIAAARLAFDQNPADYDRCAVASRVLGWIAERQTVGRRTAKPTRPDEAAVVSRATVAGHWLEGHLATAYGLEPSNLTEAAHVQAQH